MNSMLETIIKASNCDIKITPHIGRFLDFVLEKNQTLNVISRKLTQEEIIFEHIYDCLAGFDFFHKYEKIADIGTGGGFPGILLGIAFPNKKILLVEKSPKKTNYLNEAIKHLNLRNTIVQNTSVELAKIDVDVITCRAFKTLKEIISMTPMHYKSGKPYVLYKARRERIETELNDASTIYPNSSHIHTIAPLLKDKERHLVVVSCK